MNVAYPNKCKRCQSPSRNIGSASLCSRLKCKGRSKLIRSLGKYRVVKVAAGTKEDPINVQCPNCDTFSGGCNSEATQAYCSRDYCHYWFDFAFEIGKVYKFVMLRPYLFRGGNDWYRVN